MTIQFVPVHTRLSVAVMFGITLLLALPATGAMQGQRVDNFELLDHQGDAQELYYFSDSPFVVLVSVANACSVVGDSLPQIQKIRDQFGPKGTRFFLLNSSLEDERAAVAREARRLKIDIPILMDDTQLVGESLGVKEAAEAFVIRTEGWEVLWHGPIKGLGKTLQRVHAGKKPPSSKSASSGCAIAFPERDRREQHKEIAYSKTIAPLLIDNCVTCHREGGIAPFAMANYNVIKGFAPMIREVVRTQRMPPWHADPAHGKFANDRSLSRTEKQTLVHWIEAGALRGEGPDTLAEYDRQWPEWALGEPDYIIDIPAYAVPASGVVEYQYPTVKNPIDKDVWVRATEIIPGDRQALHHVITRFFTPRAEGESGTRGRRGGGGLGGYVPGAEAREYAEGTGTLLPAGAMINFQMHYTPYGRDTTDRSRMGIYLHDAAPKYQRAGVVLMNTKIRIPPNTKAHTETKSTVLERPVLVYSMLPHSHYRGKASDFIAEYPDGTTEVLLSVPAYDFNWQTSYVLAEPKALPAGTKITHSTTWDNSAQNPANPDPAREVPWGRQSWDEMLFGTMSFRYLDENEEDDSSTADQFAGAGE